MMKKTNDPTQTSVCTMFIQPNREPFLSAINPQLFLDFGIKYWWKVTFKVACNIS